MAALIQFAQSRLAWLILGASALLLEACALFFQYGMHLHPCVLCVYQRVAVMGILFAAIIGLISPRGILRFPAALLWLVSAAWGKNWQPAYMICKPIHRLFLPVLFYRIFLVLLRYTPGFPICLCQQGCAVMMFGEC